MTMLIPRDRPPSRFDIGGRLLNKVQATMMEDYKEQLQGKPYLWRWMAGVTCTMNL